VSLRDIATIARAATLAVALAMMAMKINVFDTA
jgi:hypothetical protein